jgi:RNA polymerase sporulation-specific sigma factor
MSDTAGASPEAPIDAGQHLKLAYAVAWKFRRWAAYVGIDQADLAAEALLALVRAAKKYDPSRGAFATLAHEVIRWELIHLIKRKKPRLESMTLEEGRQLDVPDHRYAEPGVKDDVAALLRRLPPRERRVIELCFGLDGKGEKMLVEVGQELGLSGWRIGQLRDKALSRLRAAAG